VDSQEIADFVEGEHFGEVVELHGVAPINESSEHLLSFAEKEVSGEAGCVICTEKVAGRTCIVVDDPKLAFIKVLNALFTKPINSGVHETAVVEGSLGDGVEIGANVFVGLDSTIGENAVIHAGVVIGTGCDIGANTTIFPNAVIYDDTWIGARCRIHAGAVIGADGFSYHQTETGPIKVPQVGRVVILDGTEIGANTCIDRAFLTETIIGADSAIDNLVQIGHNSRVGANCLIAAQVGISGSVIVGNGAVLGGQVGVRDHIEIGDEAVIGGGSGVVRDLPGGAVYFGTPAIPIAQGRRAYMAWPKLPEILKRLSKLENKSD
jgi:UDP-3-O-[3-hydroxymyristoyl] glucosamine N-acyltransferase